MKVKLCIGKEKNEFVNALKRQRQTMSLQETRLASVVNKRFMHT